MKTHKLNAIDEISIILEQNGYGEGLRLGHIEYDRSVNDTYDYQIIRDCTHDGTMLFTMQLIHKSLLPLVNKTSCHMDYANKDMKDVKYYIGDMILEQTFEGNRMTDLVKIPVKCEYVFR